MIYLFGDVHGVSNLNIFDSINFPEGDKLTKDDYVVILGDLGVPWSNNGTEGYEYEMAELHKLSERPFTTLFIDGNHENFSNLKSFPTEEKFGAEVSKLDDSIYWLHRGNIYTVRGKKFFAFGGAVSLDKKRRREGLSWWRDEEPSYAEIDQAYSNLDKVNYEVDYVLTHTAPSIVIQKAIGFNDPSFHLFNDSATNFLDQISEKIKCNLWFFGHLHVDFVSYGLRKQYVGMMEMFTELDLHTGNFKSHRVGHKTTRHVNWLNV